MNNKILIIEDEESIARLEKDYLEINGFEVEIAHTGREGLSMATSQEYELIVLDLMLPEIDGFEICKRIRDTLDIPILMVSAKKEDIDKIRGLGLGADDYITKPFSPNELVARVKSHIKRYQRLIGKHKKKKQLIFRNMRIETDARRVFVDEEEIILTNKEYDLLYFLASNPDRVFSKEILLDRIWGMNHFGDGSTVTVHIGKIREKIEMNNKKGNEHNFIETIWGAGYRFNL